MDIQLAGIESRIYEIRGQRLMLDRDLAEINGVEIAQLKRSVRRNMERFEGDDFMFELTKSEWDSLRCQIGILENGRGQHAKYMPFVFTEHGVSMLSSVLRSGIAIQINRAIIRAFVSIRQAILSPPATDKMTEISNELAELRDYMNEILTDQNEINEDNRMQLELINQTLAEMQSKSKVVNRPRRRIGYEGGEM